MAVQKHRVHFMLCQVAMVAVAEAAGAVAAVVEQVHLACW